MRLKIKAALFASLCLLSACEPEDFSLADQESSETAVSVPQNGLQLLRLVNQLRKEGCRCGADYMPPVAQLIWNTDLEAAALRHARDMENNNFFDHTGSDGSVVGRRLSDTGYNWQTVGENIAWGYRDIEAVFLGWKESPGHCRNLMNSDFQHMGSARVSDYWVQDFARPRSN